MRFDGKVAVVTGAGGGLGRAHALALAARGAKVVVNDFGGARDGSGRSAAPAETVVAEIESAGGEAMTSLCSVADQAGVDAMTKAIMSRWGRIDILVNNAGVLRDKSFSKMDIEDFRFVFDVHLMGAVICTKAVWPIMQAQNYGRIAFTTSSSGLFGNFGQANYGAAKMALVGLMQTLSIEGAKHDIRVNCLAPTAATRMTEGVLPEQLLALMRPETVSPGLLTLVGEDAPNRAILCAGAGVFSRAYVTYTSGVFIGDGEGAPDEVRTRFAEISAREGEIIPDNAMVQGANEADKAASALDRGGDL